jgi:hypothetical protein
VLVGLDKHSKKLPTTKPSPYIAPNLTKMKQIIIAIALTASTYLANAQAVPSTTLKLCNVSEKIDGKLSSSQIVYDDTKEVNYF